uniref:Uncharacterized protein n=1 Tax=candidate division WOR-3 bacterium TaxID=2052148 RepID=A0A7C3N809_UNCW3
MLDIFISSVTSQLSVLIVGEKINYFKKIEDKDFLVELPKIFDNDDVKFILKNDSLRNVFILSKVGKLTGMRIGESFAKGLIFGDDESKIIRLNPHDVLGFFSKSEKKILSVIKIRKNSYSLALFSNKNIFERISKDFELFGNDLKSYIERNKFFIIGEGAKDFLPSIDEKYLFPDALKMYQYHRGIYGKDNGLDTCM